MLRTINVACVSTRCHFSALQEIKFFFVYQDVNSKKAMTLTFNGTRKIEYILEFFFLLVLIW